MVDAHSSAWSRVGWLDDPSLVRRITPPMTETTRAHLLALERAMMMNQLLLHVPGSREVRSATKMPRVLTYVDDEVGCGLGCRFI